MIPILCSVDHLFKNLYDTFVVPTFQKYGLPQSFSLHLNTMSKCDSQPNGFGTISYFLYRQHHIRFLLNFLEDYPENEHIISIDADILFLRGFMGYMPHLISQNRSNQYDVFLSRDSNSDRHIPNIGVMVLRNCMRTKQFLNNMLYYIGSNNQPTNSFYQQMLPRINSNNEFRLSLMSSERIIHNNQTQNTLRHKLLSPNTSCFHATSTANIYQKALILSTAMCFLEERGL